MERMVFAAIEFIPLQENYRYSLILLLTAFLLIGICLLIAIIAFIIGDILKQVNAILSVD